MVGALIVGAIGSGIWDILVKPSGKWIGQAILTTATLGSNSVKDSVYVEAARGLHDAPSLLILGALASIILLLPFFSLASTISIHLKFRKSLREAIEIESGQELEAGTDTELTKKDRRIADFKKSIGKSKRVVGRLLPVTYVMALGLFVACGSIFISMLKIEQASEALAFFSQSLTICKPYMSDNEAEIFESRFARIQSKADYIVLTNELRQFATTKQLKLPTYSPW